MNIERIRERVANGFKPFTISTSDGRHYPVPHPDFIALGKNVIVVIGKNDRVSTLDALHITSIEERLSQK
ncbi:MAG: hypothetical protein ACREIC_06110 [Limisphaerales bacterium]